MRAVLETMVAGVDTNEPDVAAYSLHTVDDDPNVLTFTSTTTTLRRRRLGQTDHMAALGAALRGIAGARPEITRPTQIAGVDR